MNNNQSIIDRAIVEVLTEYLREIIQKPTYSIQTIYTEPDFPVGSLLKHTDNAKRDKLLRRVHRMNRVFSR